MTGEVALPGRLRSDVIDRSSSSYAALPGRLRTDVIDRSSSYAASVAKLRMISSTGADLGGFGGQAQE